MPNVSIVILQLNRYFFRYKNHRNEENIYILCVICNTYYMYKQNIFKQLKGDERKLVFPAFIKYLYI